MAIKVINKEVIRVGLTEQIKHDITIICLVHQQEVAFPSKKRTRHHFVVSSNKQNATNKQREINKIKKPNKQTKPECKGDT